MRAMLAEENFSGIFMGEYSFLGIVISALIILSIFVLILVYWVFPKIKKSAKGFNVGAKLAALEKPTYKRIKRMYFENYRYRRYIENLIVSNYGIFVVNAHFETGKISQNANGKLIAEKDGAIRVLGDYEHDNKKTIDAIKRLSKIFDNVPFYSLVVLPNAAEVDVKSDFGFFGNIKDMLNYIKSNSTVDLGEAKREEMYSVICKENSRNQQ